MDYEKQKELFLYIWVIYIPDFIYKINVFKTLLSSMELEKSKRFLFCEHQNRFVITKAIQRILIGKYLDLDPHSIEFGFGSFGKPYIKNGRKLNFNISHSGDIIVLAFKWGTEIGVDVEENCSSSLGQGIEEMIFSEKEALDYTSVAMDKKKEMFFRSWTRKESILKCTGYGLSYDLKQVAELEKNGIFTHSFIPFPNYSGAVSTYNSTSIIVYEHLSKI
jgi:4'-phosphopantetheinyl transferase